MKECSDGALLDVKKKQLSGSLEQTQAHRSHRCSSHCHLGDTDTRRQTKNLSLLSHVPSLLLPPRSHDRCLFTSSLLSLVSFFLSLPSLSLPHFLLSLPSSLVFSKDSGDRYAVCFSTYSGCLHTVDRAESQAK